MSNNEDDVHNNYEAPTGRFRLRPRPESTTRATSETPVEHLSQKAEDVADVQRQRGAAQLDRFAASVHRAADEIGRESPRVSKLIHDGAEHIDRASRALKENSVADLVRLADRKARERPAVFIASSVALGFAMSRFLRATKPGPDSKP